MFTFTEVAALNDIQPTYRILKPWWDVFMDYLGVAMLMMALFTLTTQITKDQVACHPYLDDAEEASGPSATQRSQEVAALHQHTAAEGNTYTNQHTTNGVKTNLDYQQFIFINQICYHCALPWYSKYFPYLALLHTVFLWASGNILFKYPKTSSKIEHFVLILGRCFESPWTTKALSETACEDSGQNKQMLTDALSPSKEVLSEEKEEAATSSKFSADKPLSPVLSSMTILDKKDGEQAKALFEKVRNFRAHVEESDSVYKVYVVQRLVKTITFVLLLTCTSTFLVAIQFKHECLPEIEHLVGYTGFFCTHNMAFMLKGLLIIYMVLIPLYGIACLYSLFWVFRRPLKKYSFEKMREESSFSDIPDVRNDFAFLLHMVDQYDQLYSKRFGVFLSEVSENKLQEISLNHQWTLEKVRAQVTSNQELCLSSLSGLPNAVFDLTDLKVLKLDRIPEANFSAQVSKMTNLQELHLYQCPAKVEQTGFDFLCDHLLRLHVHFTVTAEIPHWVYLLRNLQELNLIGKLNTENPRMSGLDSMRDLKHLETLCFKSNLAKIPSKITELSPHLSKLIVDNEDHKLYGLSNLKKLTNLIELELYRCDLELIPNVIFILTNLQSLDLRSNNIQTMDEVVHLQQLKRLINLKLDHNKISTIPSTIARVKSIEVLDLSHNRLQSLPKDLFLLPKLRHLDVGHNSIMVLPKEVGGLQNLQYLCMDHNKLEVLPWHLFKCSHLKTLILDHNALKVLPEDVGQLLELRYLELTGNCLDKLPDQLKYCPLLRRNTLIVEQHLIDALPVEVQEIISQETPMP